VKKLGRVDSYDIWRDPKLVGHLDVTPEIIGRVRDSAIFLLVLSPDYLASDWCRGELRSFDEAIRGRKVTRGRIIVIEFDQVDRHRRIPELADVKGYRLWLEDPDTGNPRTLGYPIVRDKDEEYHNRLSDLCIELVRQLETLKQCEMTAPGSVAGPAPDTRPPIYLADVTEEPVPDTEAHASTAAAGDRGAGLGFRGPGRAGARLAHPERHGLRPRSASLDAARLDAALEGLPRHRGPDRGGL
jgi:hypothetical protein